MRRFTLITIILLFLLLVVAAVLQLRAGHGPRRFCGPGVHSCAPSPTATG